MSRGITRRQEEVLEFIEDYFAKHNTSPTLQEMAGHFGISQTGVWYHLKALERKDLVTVRSNSARGIFLAGWKDHVPGISLIDLYDEDEWLGGRRRKKGIFNASALALEAGQDYFCLKMSSPNLVNAGIRAGDYLVMRKARNARSGQIVIASPEGDDKLHLRTYLHSGTKIILQAECDNMGNISCQSCTVHAIVHAVVRFYG